MLPDKQSTSDPMPTGLFMQVADVLEPFLVEHFNRSLSEGLVPSVVKAAYVTVAGQAEYKRSNAHWSIYAGC